MNPRRQPSAAQGLRARLRRALTLLSALALIVLLTLPYSPANGATGFGARPAPVRGESPGAAALSLERASRLALPCTSSLSCERGRGPLSYPGASSWWANLSGTLNASPGCRSSFGMTWDDALNESVLFGGLGSCSASSSYALGDTWTFGAGSWTNRTGGTTPAARFFGTMGYDALDRDVVLVDGTNLTDTPFNETWTFGSSGWALAHLALLPEARLQAGMAYDSTDGYLVLFGGSTIPGGGTFYPNTWLYAHGNWTEATGGVQPSPRRDPILIDDPARNGLILFGGVSSSGVPLNDTWLFKAGTWSLLSAAAGPSPRWDGSGAYDQSIGAPLLFGGCLALGCNPAADDVWSFTTQGWTNLTASAGSGPSGRGSAGFAYETGTGGELMFGGAGAQGRVGDTWRFLIALSGAASMGTGPIDLGMSLAGNVSVSGAATPVDVEITGVPGCGPVGVGSFACTPNATGEFPASLLVHDGAGRQLNLSLGTVVVNARPNASATATPSSGTVPFSVRLTGRSLGGTNLGNDQWHISGVAEILLGPNVTYNLTTAGNYTFAFSVSDQFSETASASVTVNAFAPFLAAVDWSLISEACVGSSPTSTYSLTGSTSGGLGPYTVSWSVGGSSLHVVWNTTAGTSPTVTMNASDSRGTHTSASATLTSPPLTCGTTPIPPPAGRNATASGPQWETFALVGTVAAAVALLVGLVLWRRRPPPTTDAPPAPSPVTPADRSPPPSNASPASAMPAVEGAAGADPAARNGPEASLSQQILTHLYRQGRLGPGEVAPVSFTQEGIGRALGRDQSAFAKTLVRLEASGLLVTEVQHVTGGTRRRKVYRLTDRGETLARSLRTPSPSRTSG
ncbi:MAG: helix-turn-helix transcriptional regulator [Thermoplasmata archaeon]|nr:helix-turn-helix transcriptional regulator [Thermoplasmata archaeon]